MPIMSGEDRLWKVSLRSQDDQQVSAASAKEENGHLIFTDSNGDLSGKFVLAQVQGYSTAIKRVITFVVRSVLDEPEPAVPVEGAKIWVVLLPSKKRHRVEASQVEEDDGNLILTDTQGDLVGKFRLSEVQGYSIGQESPEDEVKFAVDNRLDRRPD
jgi:hypothetical protein